MCLLGGRAGLLPLRHGVLSDRQRLGELTEQHPVGGQRGEDPGPQRRRGAIGEQCDRFLAGIHRGMRVAGLPVVPSEPFQQPHAVVRRRSGAGSGQRRGGPARGALRIPGPACGLRRLLKQARARLG